MSFFSNFRSIVYSLFSKVFTSHIYDVLRVILNSELKNGDVIIEIGPGCGSNLREINDIIEKNDCYYRGIDYDNDYVAELRRNLPKVKNIEIYAGPKEGDFLSDSDTHDYRFNAPNKTATIFILMIECTMLMNQEALAKKVQVLRRQISNQGNKVHFIFAHTEFYKVSFMGWLAFYIKPYLKYITTVDFGVPIYRDDFDAFVSGFAQKSVDRVEELRIPSLITVFGPINIVQVKCADS